MAAEILYPVAKLAELWSCSANHIYDLIARGELAATQIAKGRAKTRISESAIAEYVGRNTTTASKRRAA